MTAGFNFNNYAAGFCSATPALRGNEVSMDTIDLGNSESLVCGVFPNQDGTFTAMTYTKSKTFTVAGWKETQVSDMDFDTIMEKAYEEYFEGLAEGEEALSFSEFKQALSSSAKSNG
ncbi:Putative prophage protein [Escherichia coli]